MKQAIAIGLRSQWGNYELVEVTSKDKYYYYGRTLNGQQTRGAIRDLKGEFVTVEVAREAMNKIVLTKQQHAPIIKAAQETLRKVEGERDAAIIAVIESYTTKGSSNADA